MRAIILLFLLSWAATAEATQISTDFEFDAGGSFAIGPEGQRAFFTGGLVTEPDPPIVPTSGTHVWLIGPGETGVIDFESRSADISLSAFTTSSFARIRFYVCCVGGYQQYSSTAFGPNQWQAISRDFSGTARLVVENIGMQPGQFVAIDNLSYEGSDILVPEPSGIGLAITAIVTGLLILLWRFAVQFNHPVISSVTPASRK